MAPLFSDITIFPLFCSRSFALFVCSFYFFRCCFLYINVSISVLFSFSLFSLLSFLLFITSSFPPLYLLFLHPLLSSLYLPTFTFTSSSFSYSTSSPNSSSSSSPSSFSFYSYSSSSFYSVSSPSSSLPSTSHLPFSLVSQASVLKRADWMAQQNPCKSVSIKYPEEFTRVADSFDRSHHPVSHCSLRPVDIS